MASAAGSSAYRVVASPARTRALGMRIAPGVGTGDEEGRNVSAAAPDFKAITERQQGVWSSGDFGRVGALIVLHGELLCESLDIHPGERVLDVGAGSGVGSLAAARRWADVTSTDFVPELLEQAKRRAEADGAAHHDADRRRAEPALRRRLVRRRDLDVRRDVRSGPAAGRRRARSRLPPGGRIGMATGRRAR